MAMAMAMAMAFAPKLPKDFVVDGYCKEETIYECTWCAFDTTVFQEAEEHSAMHDEMHATEERLTKRFVVAQINALNHKGVISGAPMDIIAGHLLDHFYATIGSETLIVRAQFEGQVKALGFTGLPAEILVENLVHQYFTDP